MKISQVGTLARIVGGRMTCAAGFDPDPMACFVPNVFLGTSDMARQLYAGTLTRPFPYRVIYDLLLFLTFRVLMNVISKVRGWFRQQLVKP